MTIDNDLRETLRDKLKQRRAVLVEDLRDEAVSAEGTLAVRSQRGTADDEIVDSMDAVDIAETARDASELAAVDRALQRLDTADFGVCTDCGAEIEPARLVAEPTVLRCAACQQRYEHQHHTPTGGRL